MMRVHLFMMSLMLASCGGGATFRSHALGYRIEMPAYIHPSSVWEGEFEGATVSYVVYRDETMPFTVLGFRPASGSLQDPFGAATAVAIRMMDGEGLAPRLQCRFRDKGRVAQNELVGQELVFNCDRRELRVRIIADTRDMFVLFAAGDTTLPLPDRNERAAEQFGRLATPDVLPGTLSSSSGAYFDSGVVIAAMQAFALRI